MKPDLSKRFWCYGYSEYYPSGGMDDLKFTTDDLDEAMNFSDKYYDIVDIEKREIIKRG